MKTDYNPDGTIHDQTDEGQHAAELRVQHPRLDGKCQSEYRPIKGAPPRTSVDAPRAKWKARLRADRLADSGSRAPVDGN